MSGTDGRTSRWALLRRSVIAGGDLLFPSQCVCCGAECMSRHDAPLFCETCDAGLAISTQPSCLRCALLCSDVDLALGNCGNCRGRKLLFREARTIGAYDGLLRTTVLKMKHAAGESLAKAAGTRLAEVLQERPLPQHPDVVVAVPMHWLKRLWRGTNPAETLARAVARQLDLRLVSHLLVCRRLLRRQATLRPAERRKNVRGAFRASRRWNIAGQSVLLVDDVMTTGATAHEAARALRAAGAAEVFVATVARSTPLA